MILERIDILHNIVKFSGNDDSKPAANNKDSIFPQLLDVVVLQWRHGIDIEVEGDKK